MSWIKNNKKYSTNKKFYEAHLKSRDEKIKVLDYSIIKNDIYELIEKEENGKKSISINQLLIDRAKDGTHYREMGEGYMVDFYAPLKFVNQVTVSNKKIEKWVNDCIQTREEELKKEKQLKRYRGLPENTSLIMNDGQEVIFVSHHLGKMFAGFWANDLSKGLCAWNYSSINHLKEEELKVA